MPSSKGQVLADALEELYRGVAKRDQRVSVLVEALQWVDCESLSPIETAHYPYRTAADLQHFGLCPVALTHPSEHPLLQLPRLPTIPVGLAAGPRLTLSRQSLPAAPLVSLGVGPPRIRCHFVGSSSDILESSRTALRQPAALSPRERRHEGDQDL